MKCMRCKESIISFSIIDTIHSEIGWASHILVEVDGKISLYHYQCGGALLLSYYKMMLDLVSENS